MKQHKPTFLGKVFPDDEKKGVTFMHKKYGKFNDAYGACKDSLENIDDISVSDDKGAGFTINLVTDDETMSTIADSNDNPKVKITGNTIKV